MYIWQKPNWPQFDWDDSDLLVDLSQARHKEGIFIGMMRTLDFDLRLECESEAVVEDAVKTSLIESVVLNLEHVRSSVAHYLGLSYAGLFNTDRSIDGLVKILLEATYCADVPLTNERLYRWHVLLFPHGIMDSLEM